MNFEAVYDEIARISLTQSAKAAADEAAELSSMPGAALRDEMTLRLSTLDIPGAEFYAEDEPTPRSH